MGIDTHGRNINQETLANALTQEERWEIENAAYPAGGTWS